MKKNKWNKKIRSSTQKSIILNKAFRVNNRPFWKKNKSGENNNLLEKIIDNLLVVQKLN